MRLLDSERRVVFEVRPVAIAASHDSAEDAGRRAGRRTGEHAPHGRPQQRQARTGGGVQPLVHAGARPRHPQQARRLRCRPSGSSSPTSPATPPCPYRYLALYEIEEDQLETAYAQFRWQRQERAEALAAGREPMVIRLRHARPIGLCGRLLLAPHRSDPVDAHQKDTRMTQPVPADSTAGSPPSSAVGRAWAGPSRTGSPPKARTSTSST